MDSAYRSEALIYFFSPKSHVELKISSCGNCMKTVENVENKPDNHPTSDPLLHPSFSL